MASYLVKKPYVYKDSPGYIGVTLLYPYYVCGKRYHKVKRFRIPLDMDEKEREIFLRNKKRELFPKSVIRQIDEFDSYDYISRLIFRAEEQKDNWWRYSYTADFRQVEKSNE